MPSRFRARLGLLFGVALAIRFFGLTWDGGHHFHPDERAVVDAVMRLSAHPLDLNPHFFAYGSLPLYLTRGAMAVLSVGSPWFATYDAAFLVGRALSALLGAATAVLLALLGRRLYGERAGLLAGALFAACVLPLQNAHFATSDTPLTFFVLLALFLLVRYVEEGTLLFAVLAGGATGLSLATKVSAAPLVVPLAVALLARREQGSRWKTVLGHGTLAALALLTGFVLAEPYAVLDFKTFAGGVLEQAAMVRHAGTRPFTNQFVGLPSVLYELEQLVVWGMGPFLAVAALWGCVAVGRRAVRERRARELVLLSWVVILFVLTCTFEAKFPRYLLPIYPLLVLFGAAALEEAAGYSRRGRVARGVVLATTIAYSVAFLSIYTRPHTEVTASKWFYGHAAPGSKILAPDWDEGFPLPLPGATPDRYKTTVFPYQEPDTTEKTQRLVADLAASDVLVLQTKRAYGGYTRAPGKFPATTRFFESLFAGQLGYTLEG
ncbi:MAG TPA: glycosyltransferase family 39 protein, partial [Thermoanaerobaculia bacterium]|nr:glycosyltransferase family 39 protein [Thermoanaerobaculia bacterium]